MESSTFGIPTDLFPIATGDDSLATLPSLSLSSEPQTETTQDEAEEACDESDNDWVFFDQSMDENGQFDGADALAAGLDDSPVPCDAPASYDDMFADNFFEDCQIAPGFGEDLPIFIVENPRDYDRMADFSEQFA
jgi:hypothetical protein